MLRLWQILSVLFLHSISLVASAQSIDDTIERACFELLPYMIDSVFDARENGGKSVEELKNSLPKGVDRREEPHISTLEVIDDVFDNDIPSDMVVVYTMYKSNTCWLRLKKFSLKETSYTSVNESLRQCRSPNIQAFSFCIRDVAMSRIDVRKVQPEK